MRRAGVVALWIAFPLAMLLGLRFPRVGIFVIAFQVGIASMVLAHVTR